MPEKELLELLKELLKGHPIFSAIAMVVIYLAGFFSKIFFAYFNSWIDIRKERVKISFGEKNKTINDCMDSMRKIHSKILFIHVHSTTIEEISLLMYTFKDHYELVESARYIIGEKIYKPLISITNRMTVYLGRSTAFLAIESKEKAFPGSNPKYTQEIDYLNNEIKTYRDDFVSAMSSLEKYIQKYKRY